MLTIVVGNMTSNRVEYVFSTLDCNTKSRNDQHAKKNTIWKLENRYKLCFQENPNRDKAEENIFKMALGKD